MRCQNPRCNKDVVPLTLINGKWGCPACGKTIVSYSFEINEENQELADLSKIYFLKYLEKAGQNNIKEKEMKYYLDKSKQYAELSANKNNPFGYYMLAYFYDYDYLGLNLSEAERCRLATPYYYSLCFSSLADISIKIPDAMRKNKIQADLIDLQNKAALSFQDMLLSMNHDNKILYGLDEYKRKINELKNRYNLNIELDDNKDDLDSMDLINGIINEEKEKTKTPIIGLFTLTNQKLLAIFNKSISFKRYLLAYYPFNKYQKITESIYIKSKDALENNRKELEKEPDKKVVLLILNKLAKTKNKKVKAFLTRFEKKDLIDEEVADIYNNMSINSQKNITNMNFMFYEDDIIFAYKKDLQSLFSLLWEDD